MAKLVRRDTNRNHLSHSHDYSKDNWPELLDSVKNAQLSRCGRDGSDDIIHQNVGIDKEKFPNLWKISTEE